MNDLVDSDLKGCSLSGPRAAFNYWPLFIMFCSPLVARFCSEFFFFKKRYIPFRSLTIDKPLKGKLGSCCSKFFELLLRSENCAT